MTTPAPTSSASRTAGAVLSAATLALAGCASTTLDGQWTDPQLGGTPLRGEKVLVVCEADEPVVRQICQQQMAAQLTAAGGMPLSVAPPAASIPFRQALTEHYVPAARAAGARAVLSATVLPELSAPDRGFSVGFGLGSFGSRGGAGVGISAPIGGGDGYASARYAANGMVSDAGTGRPMWTAKATARRASSLNAQVTDLAKAVVDAAQKAGLF